jgi:hypothetical protein
MAIRSDRRISFYAVPGAGAAALFLTLTTANTAAAAGIRVVTPGEQNTQSGDYECDLAPNPKPCNANAWLYYPELLQTDLGAGYAVESDGDGGAILGCDDTDAATAALAGANSICYANGNYDKSVATPPKIVIIGTFGEHDQRILSGLSTANFQKIYTTDIYAAAYKGLIARYLKYTSQIYLMTPIDLKWNAPALPSATEDLVTDVMLPAARAAAAAYPQQVTLLKTYEALTSTAALVTQYTTGSGDGQLNAAGQLKFTSMILDALQSDAGSPAADASADTGTASSGAATSGASSGAGTGSSGVASGTGTGGTGTTSTGAETGTSTGGSGSVASGNASGSVATSGAGSAGEPASGTGAGNGSGSSSPSGAETATSSPKSSGCALTGVKGSGEGAALALLSLGIVASVRRRKS